MREMIQSLLPVFLIVSLGYIVRKTGIIGSEVVNGFKTVIIRIALPAVLFTAFARAGMNPGYILVFILVFIFCLFLFLLGGALHRLFPGAFPDEYTDAYFTGFEFGMIGAGLFTAIWGMDRLPEIAVIAFGHEIFIWFVYVPILESRKGGGVSVRGILADFIRTPTIIAILSGIAVNLSGTYRLFETTPGGTVVLNVLRMLGNLIAPLILIVLGFSLTFRSVPFKKSLLLIFIRWTAVLSAGFLLAVLFHNFLPEADPFFYKSFFAFILLPPPFILPLFIRKERESETAYFSELLIYYTLLSFLGYVILMVVYS